MTTLHRPIAQARVFQLGPVQVRALLTRADTAGAYELLDFSAGPDGFGPPLHLHRTAAETFHILEGRMEFTRGDRTLTAEPGDIVHVPPNTPHAFRYTGSDRHHFLALLTPPIGMDDYFAGLETLVRASIPPDREKLARLMAAHDTHPA